MQERIADAAVFSIPSTTGLVLNAASERTTKTVAVLNPFNYRAGTELSADLPAEHDGAFSIPSTTGLVLN